MQLSMFGEDEKFYTETDQTKTCRYCERDLPKEFFRLRYKGFETDSTNGRDHICIDCTKESTKKLRDLKRDAPPKPEDGKCQCCNEDTDSFYFDHCHDSEEFRGWVCRSCNVGIGFLGDNIEGVEKALNYLKRHYG